MQSSVLTTDCSKDEAIRGLARSLPIEEMLGSVTTYNAPEGADQNAGGKMCQQLRSSARVIKKLKLDSGSSISEKKEVASLTKDEDSSREFKAKTIRPKVVWSAEDKTHFFDAIKEYGKDFDAIHEYIASKLKKKSLPETQIKTKDQVRHFYYRTCQKVSKHLKFSEEVKKVVQEYYALINYGELRRKAGAMSEKTCVKLNELMYRGATQIRAKGKTVRIKTPMCRTLRKLNQIDERPDELKLPTKVLVELRPRDMETWTYVQAMGQNPRVHCSVPLQKRLHVLLSCLNSRWRTHDQRTIEKTLMNQSSVAEEDDLKPPLDPILRVAPRSGSNIMLPKIQYSEYLTNCRISLNAYEERMGIKTRGEKLWQSTHNGLKGVGKPTPLRRGAKRSRVDSSSEKTPVSVRRDGSNGVNVVVSDVEADVESAVTHSNEMRDTDDSIVNILPDLDTDIGCDELPKRIEDVEHVEDATMKNVENELAVELIRNGWTVHESESISFGELYLMIGTESRIELEYWWEAHPEVKDEEALTALSVNGKSTSTPLDSSKQISVTLQKLLSLAKLYYRKDRVECPCGHVCTNSVNRTFAANKAKLGTVPKNLRVDLRPGAPENVTTMEELSISASNIINQRVDGLFRQPQIPGARQTALEIFRAQLDSLKPRFCQRRGRPIRNKQMVVQRMLPLLPKAGGTIDPTIVTMKVIPQGTMASEFVSIAPKISPNIIETHPPTQHSVALSPIPQDVSEEEEEAPITITTVNTTTTTSSTSDAPATETVVTLLPIAPGTDEAVESAEPELIIPPSPTPTISAFLDLELSNTDTEKIDAVNGNTDSEISSFVDFLPGDSGTVTPLSASPSRLLKDDDSHWLNSEVADFSLSSFLGHLESPMKSTVVAAPIAPCIANEDTRMSQDVEAQLQSLMTESSIDYMAKFADLAAQMASDNQKK